MSIDDKNNVLFEMDGVDYTIPFEQISKAKLVLTDELLNEYANAQDEVEL